MVGWMIFFRVLIATGFLRECRAFLNQRETWTTTARFSESNEMSPEDKELNLMTQFTNRYAKVSGTYLCSEPSVAAVVIKGLAQHKETLGAPLCPCRFYEDKEAEAKVGYWNCPCVPMRERHECHCMLFLTSDNDFAGDKQDIPFEEVKQLCGEL
mmetsp:Transcript_87879/g.170292  ORF Transcript_87879/g.170292 Transcript_87879/m.170292 type:complete len:155 (-) Transcript_87879:298-762(-)